MTKGRLHRGFVVGFCICTFELGCAFIFLRREFTKHKPCIASNVLSDVGYYAILLKNFGTMSLVTALSYIWVIVKLKKRKKKMSNYMHNRASNVPSTDAKVTNAILLTLGAYLLLYFPSVLISSVTVFIEIPHIFIVLSICQLLYFMNNLINPFIYYMTLKDFRQGYQNFLLRRQANEDNDRRLEMPAARY